VEDVGGGEVTLGVPGMVAWDMMGDTSDGKVGRLLVPVMGDLMKVKSLYKRKRTEWGGAVSVGVRYDCRCRWFLVDRFYVAPGLL